ncbi:hypothetical protein KAS42_02980 [bacterium]|nr:hypothetical protein [bacterium]
MGWLLIIIKVLGVIMAVVGMLLSSIPQKVMKFLPFFKITKRIRIVGIIRLAIAVIFLLAASQCRWSVVVAVLGIITLISGVLALTLKVKHIKTFIDWIEGRNEMFIRIMGGVVVLIGLLIIFAA